MNICVENYSVTFGCITVGNVFSYILRGRTEYYIKTTPKEHVNAVNLRTGELMCFSVEETVFPMENAEIKIYNYYPCC